jgi:hypothetical protein
MRDPSPLPHLIYVLRISWWVDDCPLLGRLRTATGAATGAVERGIRNTLYPLRLARQHHQIVPVDHFLPKGVPEASLDVL